MTLSPETRREIDALRAKSVAGTITRDEYRVAIRLLRDSRMSAAPAPKAPKAPRKTKVGSADKQEELPLAE